LSNCFLNIANHCWGFGVAGFEEHLRNLHGKSNVTANSNQDATPAAGCMYSCTPILLKNYKVASESDAG
jgi:hypothetical protein